MANLILSFEVVAPLLILMLLGAFMLRVKLFDSDMVSKLNKAAFKVFIPVLIFNNVYTSNIEEIKNIRPALFSAAVLSVAFIITMLIIPLIEKNPKKRGVMVQGIGRSNFVIYGLPLTLSLCGEEVLGKVSVEVCIVIPIINVFSVIALEIFRGGRPNLKKVLKGVITNPLIIASLLGIAALISGIKFPKVIEGALSDTGKIATPLSLIILGASINFSAVHKNLRQLIIVLFGKLILIPLIGFTLAVIFNMPKEDIAVFIAVFASPTAVSSYTMAQQMDGDSDLAAQIVAFGTTFSILTVFLWVFVLKQLSLI